MSDPPPLPPTIVIATRNRGKIREIKDLVADLPVRFLSLDEAPAAPDIVEDGATFEENALKKARETVSAIGLPAMADDSGLCVDALGGRPGVHSARYAGEGASDEDKCATLLLELKDVPAEERGARFVCVLALVYPEGTERVFIGECPGRITDHPRGSEGFGYDPIFLYEESGLTFAEMSSEDKNRVSHRGAALRAFADYLRSLSGRA